MTTTRKFILIAGTLALLTGCAEASPPDTTRERVQVDTRNGSEYVEWGKGGQNEGKRFDIKTFTSETDVNPLNHCKVPAGTRYYVVYDKDEVYRTNHAVRVDPKKEPVLDGYEVIRIMSGSGSNPSGSNSSLVPRIEDPPSQCGPMGMIK